MTRHDIESLCEEWRERAAIVEYDGGLSREDAEVVASERLAVHVPLPVVRAVEAAARGGR